MEKKIVLHTTAMHLYVNDVSPCVHFIRYTYLNSQLSEKLKTLKVWILIKFLFPKCQDVAVLLRKTACGSQL